MFIVFFGVSDLVRGDKRKDSKVIRSWSGQRLRLRCDVVHRHSIKPLFKWYRKPFTTNTIQDLFAPNNTKILIIEKINTTDFGEYYCEAKTRMVKVKQKFQVDKLGIENLVFVFCTI
jgi:dTDP-glucose pyrophosphorylase